MGLTWFWLNLAMVDCKMYEPDSSFALKLAATLFLEGQPSLGQRWWAAEREGMSRFMYCNDDLFIARNFI